MKSQTISNVLILAAAFTFYSGFVSGHGISGERFFPATVILDDPAAGDELNISFFASESLDEDGKQTWAYNPGVEWSKRITKNLQFSISPNYLILKQRGENRLNGFDDWDVGVLYEFLIIPKYESIFSLALNVTIGRTGNSDVFADSRSTFSPTFLFGQGLGALPDTVKYLRPFAITGSIAGNITAINCNVTSIDWGFAIEYSLPYMYKFVHNTGLPEYMSHLIPLVECAMNTTTLNTEDNHTTGTINPGFLIVKKYVQIGFEAIIPINKATGNKVGGVLQLHLYLDDLFPDGIGKPLFT